MLDRSSIEDKLIETNKRLFQQAKSTPTCEDKTHNKLTTESVRNKTLNGTLRRSECDTDELHAFLKLLTQPKDRRNANDVEVSEDMFV